MNIIGFTYRDAFFVYVQQDVKHTITWIVKELGYNVTTKFFSSIEKLERAVQGQESSDRTLDEMVNCVGIIVELCEGDDRSGETLKELRRKYPHLKAILILSKQRSNRTKDMVADLVRSKVVDDVIFRPITYDNFLKIVDKHFRFKKESCADACMDNSLGTFLFRQLMVEERQKDSVASKNLLPYLTLETADGRQIKVKDGDVIGRKSVGSDILGCYKTVSREHARFTIEGNRWHIESLTKSDTEVNNTPLFRGERQELKPNYKIILSSMVEMTVK